MSYYVWACIVFGILGAIRNVRGVPSHFSVGKKCEYLLYAFWYAFVLWPVILFFEAITLAQFSARIRHGIK